MTQHYIFGFGSLIDTRSRRRTTPLAHTAYPAIINGLGRGWWIHGLSGWAITWLAVQFEADAWCNGVIYPVTTRELQHTDWRERGYKRAQVPAEAITMLAGEQPDGPVWTYTAPVRALPRAGKPIWQSYVDMCLRGCMEVEQRYPTTKGFSAQFIETTQGWSNNWVDNRAGRKTDGVMPVGAIRQALHTHLPTGVNPPI